MGKDEKGQETVTNSEGEAVRNVARLGKMNADMSQASQADSASKMSAADFKGAVRSKLHDQGTQ